MMRFRGATILLVILAGGAVAQDADPKREFAELKQRFDEVEKSAVWDQIKVRRDLINQLGDVEYPQGVVPILVEVFKKDREQVCRIPAMIGLGKQGNVPALKSMVAEAVGDRNDVFRMCLPLAFAEVKEDQGIGPWIADKLLGRKRDDVLRAAVVESLGLLRTREAYDGLLEILTEEHAGERVLYETLLALARIGGAQAFDPIAPYLENDDRYIREGAVLALGETGHPGAVAKVLPLTKDVSPRVQEAVAEVAAKAKSEEAVPALIELLRTGRLRVMESTSRALAEITGEDLGIDPARWERWWKDRNAGGAAPPATPASSVATYYGMRIFSDRVLFIIDCSGSMSAGDPERIETARDELAKTLDQLNEKTMLNIVSFSGQPVWWQDEEVAATEENVKAAKEFASGLRAGGGTNIYDTLVEAFEKNARMDTIYLLGDGSLSLLHGAGGNPRPAPVDEPVPEGEDQLHRDPARRGRPVRGTAGARHGARHQHRRRARLRRGGGRPVPRADVEGARRQLPEVRQVTAA